MVKELEDAPRDEVVVLLDGADATTFDVAVRAAGSILLAHVRRKRRSVLVVNSAAREEQAIGSEAADWPRALEVLAAAEPTARTPAFALLEAAGQRGRSVARARRRDVAGRRAARRPARAACAVAARRVARLRRATTRRRNRDCCVCRRPGIPFAVVRPGDDLATVLSADATRAVANA